MFDTLISVLVLLFRPENLIFIIAGTVFGMIVGALPGLGSDFGLALIMPFTFSMQPIPAITLLIGIFAGCQQGGSIPAILLNTPGTGAAAATVIDGYPLTKKGRAAEALAAATIGSFIGGTIGGLILLVLAPPLAIFSLNFGPLEYMGVAFFGITTLAGLSGKSILKGLVSSCIGLFLGTVGLSTISGTSRYVFGRPELFEGINLLWLIIGLFGGSQAFLLSNEDPIKANIFFSKKKYNIGKIIKIICKKILKSKLMVLITSLIGLFLGIIPGIGGSVACWVAYGEARKFSKEKLLFGKGSLDGVLAAESANNAVVGGALIPTLALGIPGNSTTAILLGALLIQGLTPGYKLFTEQAETTYAILLSLLIANIVFLVMGLSLNRVLARVCNIENAVLWPIIIILALVGSYLPTQTMFGVYMMLGFALFALVLKAASFPLAPILVGLILGPIIEKNLYRAVIIAGAKGIFIYAFGRPIALIFFCLTFFALFYSIRFYSSSKNI